MDSTKCGVATDHSVLVVGYATPYTGENYWIVQNSWGTAWGDYGYVRIWMRDGPGICGINLAVEYPLIVR